MTDVGSIKSQPARRACGRRAPAADLARGTSAATRWPAASGPGPLAAAADLFDGRTWAVTPHDGVGPGAVAAVEALVTACGAVVVRLTPRSTTWRWPGCPTCRT